MNKLLKEIKNISKIPLVKSVLSVVTIIVVGFILFNVAFLLAWLVGMIVQILLQTFLSGNFESNYRLLSMAQYPIYLIVVAVISWYFLKSKRISVLVKATYLTMPAMIILVTIGILFNQSPITVIGLNTLIVSGAFYYMYKTKKPWQYWAAVAYVTIVALCIMIFKIEI